jgi:two-component system sensor histidine kinase AlgZ
MHPLLASPRRLLLYLIAWEPFHVLVDGILRGAGMHGWQRLALSGAMTVVFAFFALSAWFACWSAPLATASPWQIFRVQVAWAMASTFVWLALGYAANAIGVSAGAPPSIVPAFLSAVPMLTTVGLLAFLLSAAVHYVAIAIRISRAAERRALELQVAARDAELKTLRAQIDPHFLFNTLHSISGLTMADPAGARRMCVLLGDFFRSSLRLGQREAIPLGEELALIDGYLAIEQVRLGPRLRVVRAVDQAARDTLVPPLLLHPLVENAITHGIAHGLDGGTLSITVTRAERFRLAVPTGVPGEPDVVVTEDDPRFAARSAGRDSRYSAQYLKIRVVNDCDPERPRGTGTGVGLQNVQRRLATVFGSDASLATRERDGRFEAEVILPVGTEARTRTDGSKTPEAGRNDEPGSRTALSSDVSTGAMGVRT